MNKKQQGDQGVYSAISYYGSKGYIVNYPLTDNSRYDLVIDTGINLLRIQCKTTTQKQSSGSFTVCLATSGGNQSWNKQVKLITELECDIVWISTSDGDNYEFPVNLCANKPTITVGQKYIKYKV